MTEIPNYEKLGAFYLGRRYDLESASTTVEPYLYDSKDLTTHGVCVGMTGSGKTGLCISLLEEAALDGVPAIAVDPKGDLGNRLDTVMSIGATVVGALFGRKLASVSNVTRTRSALRGVGRQSREKDQIARAERELEAQRDRLEEMEAELADKIGDVGRAFEADSLELEEVDLAPRKSDIGVVVFGLAWTPWRVDKAGIAERLF